MDQPQGTTFDILINALDESRFRSLCLQKTYAKKQRYSCSAIGIFAALKGRSMKLPHPHTVLLPKNLDRFSLQLQKSSPLDSTMCFINHYPAGSVYKRNSRDVLAFLLTVPADGRTYDIGDPLVKAELARAQKILGWPKALLEEACELEVFGPNYFESFGAPEVLFMGRSCLSLKWVPYTRHRTKIESFPTFSMSEHRFIQGEDCLPSFLV